MPDMPALPMLSVHKTLGRFREFVYFRVKEKRATKITQLFVINLQKIPCVSYANRLASFSRGGQGDHTLVKTTQENSRPLLCIPTHATQKYLPLN